MITILAYEQSLFLIGIIAALIIAGILVYINHRYKLGTYYKITHNSLLTTYFDLGKYGEYLTYKELKSYERNGGRFLFNCYLPKKNGETTEIDVLLIDTTGIFVFESKNYSGWIFGDEKSHTWTQTLPRGRGRARKEHFLNPIIQNQGHIKWLKSFIGEEYPVYSVIVFSERCALKNISINSPNISVIKRNNVFRAVKQLGKNSFRTLNQAEIERLYYSLYPYTQVMDMQKLEHVENIKRHYMPDMVTEEPIFTGVVVEAPSETKANENMAGTKINVAEVCPRCGAELVIRIAKKGQNQGNKFYGCSAYPKCRFVRKI